MKYLIIYTGSITSELTNKIQDLRANPTNSVEFYQIQCSQANQLPNTKISFSDFDEIIVYLTEDMNNCPHLEFLLQQAARFSISVTMIYSSDYQGIGIPDWASNYASQVICISDIDTIEDVLGKNIYQSPDGQTVETVKTKRHC